MSPFQILLYYKYTHIEDPKALMEEQRKLCQELGLKGRILIAQEGINGTVEGLVENTEKYIAAMQQDARFADIHFKRSEGNGQAFPKLVVKVRSEIVTTALGEQDLNPMEITGQYLTAEQLHDWFESGKEFYIVDMRNNYEQKAGYFENSIFSGFTYFRDLSTVLNKLENLKDKTIVTVCTGGVRCEKASGFLVKNGFKNVYQLLDGIVDYMEKYPNQHFKGKLYVFDNRMVMGFNTSDPTHEIVGRCDKCGKPSENFVNCFNNDCHEHFICCENCLVDGKPFCREECQKLILTA